MADSSSSFSTHIKNVCGIQVALRCSPDVEELCNKNYLSFSELVRPFSQLTTEGHQVLDTAGHLYTVRDVRIRFSEPRPEPTSLGTTEESLDQTLHWSDRNPDLVGVASIGPVMNVGGVNTPSTTPWFDHYCECYHDNVPILEHEYYRHYLAAVLVVSSRHSKPIEAFQSLYRIQKEEEKRGTTSYPYWMASHHVYYYHVLLHDVTEGNMTFAKETFDRLKGIHGTATCYFLPINSVDPSSNSSHSATPEPWSYFLRIPSSFTRRTSGTEETDYSFKRFHRNKPKVSQAPSPSQTPPTNHTPKPVDSSLAPLGTVADLVQGGEIKVMLEGGEGGGEGEGKSGNLQSTSAVSLSSAHVEFGDDPLSQSEEGVVEGRSLILGECMTLEDQNSLRSFVKEFSTRLLTHLSAVLRKLNDSLQSKRTMTRRMSNFSRGVWWKVIGGGGGTGGGTTTNVSARNSEDSNLSVDSVERLMRQVGDIAFLLQNYDLAYNMHHTLKRDLQGKDLWIHFAGALEMTALSAQLLGQSRKEIQSYLEEASQIYLKTLKYIKDRIMTMKESSRNW